MLKERFLNRDDDVYADENFTDDEGSEDDAVGAGEYGVFHFLSCLLDYLRILSRCTTFFACH